jgi:hypothetical protein
MGLMHLITHRYPQSLKLECDRQATEFAKLGNLARVPIRWINRKDDLDGISQLCHDIMKDVRD